MTTASLILHNLPCSVEMPAGTGKTETIGQLVSVLAAHGKRSLVLTHTHAGVDVLKRRMKKFNVPRDAVTIRTLDSWCFDLIGSFPQLSQINVAPEPDWAQSREYHSAGRRAAQSTPVQRMLQASYELLVVDEYQDCQVWQHELIRAVAEAIPTCVLGDRMQGLFFFNNLQPVDWETDVEGAFPPLHIPVTPWRWARTKPELGEWLLQARIDLMRGNGLSLDGAPIRAIRPAEVRQTLLGMPRHPETTVAISQFPSAAALLAQQLGGAYTMIEELEGKHLRTFASIIDEGTAAEIASATAQYAVDCAFGVADKFDALSRRRLGANLPLDVRHLDHSAREAACLLNELLESPSVSTIRQALVSLSKMSPFSLFRREAWFGMLDALRLSETTDELTAVKAVSSVRNKLRLTGRRPESRIVGRALLVKGLEFEHAVIDAPNPRLPYNAHELYVCLTRGSVSVTLATTTSRLNPSRPAR